MGQLLFLPVATIASVAALAGCPAGFAWRPLAYVGRISYGLYLWHYPLIWWGWPAPLVIAASIAIAVASYERLERPFLRLKDRYARASAGEDRPANAAFLPPSGEPTGSL